MFSFEFCEISKNTFSYRIPSVAACGIQNFQKKAIVKSKIYLLSGINWKVICSKNTDESLDESRRI